MCVFESFSVDSYFRALVGGDKRESSGVVRNVLFFIRRMDTPMYTSINIHRAVHLGFADFASCILFH